MTIRPRTEHMMALATAGTPFLLLLCSVFFCGCAHSPSIEQPTTTVRGIERLPHHDIERGSDLHNVVATVAAIGHTRVWRIMDGTLNLVLPIHGTAPFDNTVHGIRSGFRKLPNCRLKSRVGELFYALQIRTLCPADVGFGGQQERVQGLIDFAQHTVDDLNEAPANLVGARRIIPLTYIHTPIDYTQRAIDSTVHVIGRYLVEFAEEAINKYERFLERREPFEAAAIPPEEDVESPQLPQEASSNPSQ